MNHRRFVFFNIFGPRRPRAIAFVDHGTLSLYHGCKDKDLKRQIAEWMMPDDTVDQFGPVTLGQQLHHDILLFPAPQQIKVPEGHAAFHLEALSRHYGTSTVFGIPPVCLSISQYLEKMH